MEEMMAATSWQAHSIRGAMAGALRKKGLAATSAKTDDVRRWRAVLIETLTPDRNARAGLHRRVFLWSPNGK